MGDLSGYSILGNEDNNFKDQRVCPWTILWCKVASSWSDFDISWRSSLLGTCAVNMDNRCS